MLSLILGTGAVTVGAVLLACVLRAQGIVSFVLAAYLLAWTEVVVVCFALSAGRWLDRWTLVACFLLVTAAATILWLVSGRPRPPSLMGAARRGASAAADPLVAFPLLVSAAALTYTLVVTLTTAPNDGDPLVYELTRAAFWRQEHGIINLHAAYEPRLDFSPPVAETGFLVTVTLSGTDQFAGLVQWVAIPMLALASYGLGRRIGLQRRPALWSASLVPMFPVVITQSWSAFTDLVFSSFTVAAVYFGIGGLGLELVPFTLAVALGIGTKFLGPIFVPLFAVILGVAQPLRRWPPLAAAGIGGIAISSAWYVRNQIEASDPAGNSGVGLQSLGIAPVVTTFQRLTVEIFDLSGASGRSAWLYFIAALVLVALALSRWALGDRHALGLLVAAGLIAVTPYVVSLVAQSWASVGLTIGDALGRPDLVDQLRDWRVPTASDGAFSWFGPVGAVLALGALPVAAVEILSRRLTKTALILATTPIAALALVSFVISYQRYQGRYFISAFALCVAVWGGFALRRRWVGTVIVGMATVTVLLSLVNSMGKPSGLALFEGDTGMSVWSMPRWMQQGILRPTPPERDEILTIRYVQERVPDDASLGIALVDNSFAAPYFGRNFRRTLSIIDAGDAVPRDVDWIVAAPERVLRGCRNAWTRVRTGTYGWTVWRRMAPDTCSARGPFEPH